MTAIAYITDREMFEYHRLNGSRTMNFWFFGNNKRLKSFQQGDIVFFWVKGTERRGSKEKGIQGYGRLSKVQMMGIKQMWNAYHCENGCATQADFQEAVLKSSKEKEQPSKINSFYLTDVYFFQSPVYLSEIGIHVPNKVEGFIYLEKEDPQAIAKILAKAKQSGMDMWSLIMNEEKIQENFIEFEQIRYTLTSIIKRANFNLSGWDIRKARKLLKNYQLQEPELQIMKSAKEGYIYQNGIVTFVLPLFSNDLFDEKNQMILGHAFMIKHLFQEEIQCQQVVRFKLIGSSASVELERWINKELNDNLE